MQIRIQRTQVRR